MAAADEYILADTAVLSLLTKASDACEAYQALIGERRLAVSFQTEAELLSANFSEKRQQRVNDLLAVTLKLPHSESTNVWYARVAEVRKTLKRSSLPGSDASDADMWIISSALEYGFPLASQDTQQVHLARATQLMTVTYLQGLRDDNPVL